MIQEIQLRTFLVLLGALATAYGWGYRGVTGNERCALAAGVVMLVEILWLYLRRAENWPSIWCWIGFLLDDLERFRRPD